MPVLGDTLAATLCYTDHSGNPVVGDTVEYCVVDPINALTYDFADDTFKASASVGIKHQVMTEVEPGVYVTGFDSSLVTNLPTVVQFVYKSSSSSLVGCDTIYFDNSFPGWK